MIPAWVGDYVGLPYQEGGRARSGLDCYGLLRLVINERFGGQLPEYEAIVWREDRDLLASLMEERVRLWQPVPHRREQAGDGVLLRVMGRPIHVGVVIAPGWMLHVEAGCDSVLERYDTGTRWKRRVLGFYRHAV
jgi:cell wall-associated NlpC family hydrolase